MCIRDSILLEERANTSTHRSNLTQNKLTHPTSIGQILFFCLSQLWTRPSIVTRLIAILAAASTTRSLLLHLWRSFAIKPHACALGVHPMPITLTTLAVLNLGFSTLLIVCLLYTSPSPRDS